MLHCNQQMNSSLIYPCAPRARGFMASTEALIYIYIQECVQFAVVFSTFCAAEVEVAAVSCDKLKLSYTVNPLPSGSRDTTLQSLVVRYQAILRGSPQSSTVPLNGSATEGVLCISGLASNTGYRITYSVEVSVGDGISLPSDVPEPIEVSTGRTCDQQQQCQESSSPRTTTPTPPPTSCTTPTPPSCPRPTVITPSTPPPTTTPSRMMTTTQPPPRPTTPTGELVQHLAKHSTALDASLYVFM